MKRSPQGVKVIEVDWSALLETERRVFDQNAKTAEELIREFGLSGSRMRDKIARSIKEGRIERVWKDVGGVAKPAYREKR